MDFQSNNQNDNDLLNTIFQEELLFFNAAFDIIKNEVIPSITLTLESLQRAEQEYRNAQNIRETRLETINKNESEIPSVYFSPICNAIRKKISKYYEFVNEEFEQLLLSLNQSSTSAQNMIAFQAIWQEYESMLQECITGTTDNTKQEGQNTP